jgi:UDP-2,4-diacetamido-2,4,6-trideoxy-beta-L-altropyranose hydrolase
MQITFRVDASATIGTGHVMRCLTLADELSSRGAQCTFISRHLPAFLQELVESRQHTVRRIGDGIAPERIDELAYAHFLGTSQSQDAKQTLAIPKELRSDWLIIDHYAIDRRWESQMRSNAKKILVIDDLADRDHDCDLLVDQNLYADMWTRYRHRLPSAAKVLLGIQYAILRPEFRNARKHATIRKGRAQRLFVFFGGMDSANYTLPVLQAIARLKIKIEINAVIGAEHPALKEIQTLCQEQGYHCHVQTQRMAELLLQADIAIGAGGSTSWERGCLGLPTLAFIVAPNQEALTLQADHLGLLQAATSDIRDADALSKEMQDFLDADEARERMSKACLDTIDAQGAQRIVDQMHLSRIHLRAAIETDSKLLFEWRNHPSIREISTHSEPIKWESHKQWFNRVLQAADRIVYIAEDKDEPVGVIRFDINHKQAEVSLYLAPDQKGKGLGTRLLLSGEDAILGERPEITEFVATVLEGNEASHRLFRRCGYQYGDSIYTKNI